MNVHWVFDDTDRWITMSRCPHTTYGDDGHLVSGRFPIANLFHYWRCNWWGRSDVHWQWSPVADRPNNYAYNIGTWNDAAYWAGWSGNDQGFESWITWLPEPVLADAQQGRALLVIDNLNEGFADTRLWQHLHDCCRDWSVPPKSLCFMSGNLSDPAGYAAWCDAAQISDRISVIGMPHLMYQQQLVFKQVKTPTWADHEHLKLHGDRLPLFNCLNRVSRNHRELFMLRLIERELVTGNLISHDRLRYHAWTAHDVPQDLIDRADALLPLIVDDADFNNNKAMQIAPDIYLRSWISVITETHAWDEPHQLFISEKLWKPLFALQPFMVWGHAGTLALLRSWGFETFDCLWDESYDHLPDLERLDAIQHNLAQLRLVRNRWAWLQQAKEICLHNQSWFLAQQWFDSTSHGEFMAAYAGLNT